MKKILAIFLAALTLFSTVCITASAEEAKTVNAVRGEVLEIVFALPEEYAEISSGSISFSYDKRAFDYESGSAKWLFKSMFKKSVDEEQKTGIFAFSSAKAISGNFFTLKLKVKDAVEFGTYSVSATLKLNGDAYEIPVAYSITVGEYVEVDDETTPEDFAGAVGMIVAEGGAQDSESIENALALWSKLTAGEKEAAADAYEQLVDVVESYNAAAERANDASEKVIKSAFSVISQIFDYVSKLFEALCKAIWN